MDYREEILRIAVKVMHEEYDKGYLQGVWDFLQEIKKKNKLPIEIFEELVGGKK